MENMEIKKWYLETFKGDTLGEDINEGVTFNDLFIALDTYKDIYELLGENIDSIIRERAFGQLADIMGVEYNDIYEQWLQAD